MSMLYKIGLGFCFALAAMLIAGLIEMYRVEQSPAAANWYDEAARNNISPCKNIDNYDPNKYQGWVAGTEDDEPTNCDQICNDYDPVTQLLLLTCIDCDDIPQMSSLSIFWQIPQFVVIGLSEIFATITSLEFFYSQAPSRMRSVSRACNLFTNALGETVALLVVTMIIIVSCEGSWLTIPLTLLVNINPNSMWITTDIDDGHLDWYYFLLAGIYY